MTCSMLPDPVHSGQDREEEEAPARLDSPQVFHDMRRFPQPALGWAGAAETLGSTHGTLTGDSVASEASADQGRQAATPWLVQRGLWVAPVSEKAGRGQGRPRTGKEVQWPLGAYAPRSGDPLPSLQQAGPSAVLVRTLVSP